LDNNSKAMKQKLWLAGFFAMILIGVAVPSGAGSDVSTSSCGDVSTPLWLTLLKYFTYFCSLLVAIAALFSEGIGERVQRDGRLSWRLTPHGYRVVSVIVIGAVGTVAWDIASGKVDDRRTGAVSLCLRELTDARAATEARAIALATAEATAIAKANALADAVKAANRALGQARHDIQATSKKVDTTLDDTQLTLRTNGSIERTTEQVQSTSVDTLANVERVLYPLKNLQMSFAYRINLSDPRLQPSAKALQQYLLKQRLPDDARRPTYGVSLAGAPKTDEPISERRLVALLYETNLDFSAYRAARMIRPSQYDAHPDISEDAGFSLYGEDVTDTDRFAPKRTYEYSPKTNELIEYLGLTFEVRFPVRTSASEDEANESFGLYDLLGARVVFSLWSMGGVPSIVTRNSVTRSLETSPLQLDAVDTGSDQTDLHFRRSVVAFVLDGSNQGIYTTVLPKTVPTFRQTLRQ
jgi:hypothetical protein